MTVARHSTTGGGTTGANMYGRYHVDKEAQTARGILYAPGGGGDETSWQGDSATNPNVSGRMLREVTKDTWAFRFFTFATAWTWGNSTIITRMTDAYAEAVSNHQFNSSTVHLMGSSLGACCVLNWAKANLSKVASISLVIPAVDIQDIDDNLRLDPYALPEPKTAYGGVRPPDASNPADNAASFTSTPIKIWYSNNDTICIPATVTAFGAGSGATMVNLGDQTGFIGVPGHNALNLDPVQVAQFISANDVAPSSLTSPSSFVTTAGRGQ